MSPPPNPEPELLHHPVYGLATRPPSKRPPPGGGVIGPYTWAQVTLTRGPKSHLHVGPSHTYTWAQVTLTRGPKSLYTAPPLKPSRLLCIRPYDTSTSSCSMCECCASSLVMRQRKSVCSRVPGPGRGRGRQGQAGAGRVVRGRQIPV